MELYLELKKEFNMVLIGISKFDGTNNNLVKNPTNAHTVALNDYLIVIGNPDSKNRIFDKFQVEEGM